MINIPFFPSVRSLLCLPPACDIGFRVPLHQLLVDIVLNAADRGTAEVILTGRILDHKDFVAQVNYILVCLDSWSMYFHAKPYLNSMFWVLGIPGAGSLTVINEVRIAL